MAIPNFPEFKSLELSDRVAINAITSKFEPFSDFNFVSLWAWNLDNKVEISQLHENLVIKTVDYNSAEPFCTFIGTDEVNKTANALIKYSNENFNTQTLKLVTEPSIREIDNNHFEVTEDRDNFDYIYSTNDLSTFPGRKFAKKRNRINALLRTIPDVTNEQIDLSCSRTQLTVINFLKKLSKVNNEAETTSDDDYNLPVLRRLLDCVSKTNIMATSVLINNKISAVLISEIINTKYAVGHIMSADKSIHSGLHTYLLMTHAQELNNSGVTLYNFEQDLGKENLRVAKTRYRPISFLKKYKISYPHTE